MVVQSLEIAQRRDPYGNQADEKERNDDRGNEPGHFIAFPLRQSRSVRFSYHVGMTAVICLHFVKSWPPHERSERALYPANCRGGA